MTETPPRGMSLYNKILLGLVLGALSGVTVNLLVIAGKPLPPGQREIIQVLGGGSAAAALATATQREPTGAVRWLLTYVMEPVGQIYLRMLLMTVVPLVFASLAVGVAKLGALGHLGRIGGKAFAYFVFTMTMSVTIGLVLVNVIQPGVGLPDETRAEMVRAYGAQAKQKAEVETGFGIQTFINIVPRNPLQAAVNMEMLGVIFFALLVGVGLTAIDRERARAVLQVLEGVGELMVFIIELALKLAPYGVFALIFTVTARFGFDILVQLGKYVFVVLLGLALQMFVVLALLVRWLARLSPLEFFRRIRAVIITAFSTSSSSATLPTSIKIAEHELGVPAPIAGFVLPLGATMNMNGTALYEGVTAVFLAQVFGKDLVLAEQMVVIVLSVLTAIGAAGVPGGSLPLLVLVIAAVGVPPEMIAIIIGVDRLLDMCRTTLNVVGDVSCAAFIARSEGYELLQPPSETEAAEKPIEATP